MKRLGRIACKVMSAALCDANQHSGPHPPLVYSATASLAVESVLVNKTYNRHMVSDYAEIVFGIPHPNRRRTAQWLLVMG